MKFSASDDEPSYFAYSATPRILRRFWQTVEPHVDYLKQLNATVDVFCGYRSNGPVAA